MFEGLYALDDANRPVPLLAEGLPVVSRDGLTTRSSSARV